MARACGGIRLTQHRRQGPSRCFPFWQELLACYVVNTDTAEGEGKSKCGPALEDYYECMHHKKEVSKMCLVYSTNDRRANMVGHAGGQSASNTNGVQEGRAEPGTREHADCGTDTEPRPIGQGGRHEEGIRHELIDGSRA